MKTPSLILAIIALFALHGLSAPSLRNERLDGKNIIGLWLMGQSLCEGSQSLPMVTPHDTGSGNYAFKRGVRTWAFGDHSDNPEQRPAGDFALVPLTAAQYGGLGETIANGLADHLSATLAPGGAASQKTGGPPRFLSAYAGQGGRMIDELSGLDQSTDLRTPESRQHGGGYYRTSLDDALRARKTAQSLGKGFAIAALVWMQGEANGGPTGGINPSRWDAELPRPLGQEWYRDRLINYRKQWSQDLQAITGQKGEIPLFTYQTLGPAGEAQLMAADVDPDITMVGPHYMVPSAINSRYAGRYGDAIHLAADGERWYGEQVAKVVHRVLVQGERWQPLRPRRAWIDPSRTSVLVAFHVPRPPLVVDGTLLARQQYQAGGGFSSLCGFKISNPAGIPAMIAAVELESTDLVRIRLSSPLQAGAGYHLSYGFPYSGQIGKITSIRSGAAISGQATTEMLVGGDLREPLQALVDEGAFTVSNMLSAGKFAQAPVRHIHVEKGATVLRFENRELRDQVNFAVGQTLTAQRPFAYGNLRDSDPEKAVYHFADAGYGRRTGQPYPLWNWCVLFKQFPVSEN